MNKKCFRLVFNRRRGLLMPVGEGAPRHGGEAAGGTCPHDRPSGVAASVHRVAQGVRALCLALIACGTGAGALAQVVAHPEAGPRERPTVLQAGNGAPLVNFQTPSAAGVSRSVLSQFDVDAKGVILNNSREGAATRLGGWVQGNPWLAKGPARIILNEVRSSQPSSLRGDVEVAGQRAQVVVANPAGITCDGCGFINAGHATLTTGIPLLQDGELRGYRVEGGTLRVGAGGMDATMADVTELLARSVEVGGQVVARSLGVMTGAGEVRQDASGQWAPVGASAGPGPAPAWAIDVSALGGLYAGSIRLVANEAGAGVRNAGSIGASAGGVIVTAAGFLENSGSTVARDNVSLQVGSLASPGLLAAGIDDANHATLPGTVTVQAAGDIRMPGRTVAGASVALEGQGMVLSGGRIDAVARVDLQAEGSLDNSGGWIAAGEGIQARAGQALRNVDGVLEVHGAQASLHLAAARVDNRDGRITNLGAGALRIDAGQQLRNGHAGGAKGMGLIGANGTMALVADEVLNGDGGAIVAARSPVITTRRLDNSGGHLQSLADLAIDDAQMVVRNQGGRMEAGRDIHLTLDSLDNTGGRIATATGQQGDVILTIAGVFNNTQGRVGADRDVGVSASRLTGAGEFAARRDLALALDAGYTHSADNLLSAGRDLSLRLGGDFDNPSAATRQDGAAAPTTLSAVRDLRIEAANIANQGDLVAGGWLALDAARIVNSGSLVGASLSARASEELRNEGPAALIGATDEAGTLQLLAPRVINRDPVSEGDGMPTTTILGLGRVVIAGDTAGGEAYARAQTVLNESARIVAGGDLQIVADTLTQQRRLLRASSTHDVAQPGESGSVVYTPDNPDVPGGRYVEPPHGGRMNSDYIRTDYTAAVARNRIEAISPKSQIEAGGDFHAQVGSLQNYGSAITAAGSIPLDGVMVDNDSWRGATPYGEQRSYSGVYVYRTYRGEYWTSDPWTDPPIVTPLGGYDASVTAGGSIGGNGNTLRNVSATTPHTPLGGQAGQPVAPGPTGSGSATFDPFALPAGGLYRVNSSAASRYLVETNEAFTQGRAWASSDTYFQEMGLDPSQAGRRLGDGFYEQQLVRSQLMALTGRAVLDAADAQAQFAAMLSAGAQVVQSLQLAPGMALSSEQVAALTRDVVLMETRVVDGQSVLVPVVYLAAASRHQLLPTGSLIAARSVVLTDTGDVRNSGVIRASQALVIDGERIDSRGGQLEGAGLLALATRPGGDIDLTSARVRAGSLDVDAGGRLVVATEAQQLDAGGSLGERSITRLGQAARVDVQGDARLRTGGDLIQSGASLAVGGDLQAQVGGSWRMDSVEMRETSHTQRAGGHASAQVIDQVGSRVSVGGTAQVHVAQDLVARGGAMDLRGGGSLVAGRDVTLDAAMRSERVDSSSASGRHHETRQQLDERVMGTQVTSGADLVVLAGRNMALRGASVQADAGAAAVLQAGQDVTVGSVEERHALQDTHVSRQRGVVNSRTIATDDRTALSQARGSSISADAVTVVAGRDLRVQGSQVVATRDVDLGGGRDVTVEAATETRDEAHARQERRSGLFSSGGLSVTLGSRKLEREQETFQTQAVASSIGSVEGHVRIGAGQVYRQAGSDVLAPRGDITIDAGKVDIVESQEASRSETQTRFSQSGMTFALSNPVVSAVQTADQMRQAAGHTSDPRMQALAAATTALAAKGAMDAVAKNPATAGGIDLRISLGSSRSDSQSAEAGEMAAGSRVTAGRDLAIRARGDGADSDVTIQGSGVKAGREVVLQAEGDVALVAARNRTEQTSSNNSASASIGVSLGTSGFSVNASASRGRGNADGTDTAWTNTQVEAGDRVSIVSGSDTILRGAVVSGARVQMAVRGDLVVESLQDTSEYASRQRSSGGSVSVGLDPGSFLAGMAAGQTGASVQGSRSRIDSAYASVTQQSALRAGDGGFDVEVQGGTRLVGGAITSTQAAVDAGSNRFDSQGLEVSDIENRAAYTASSAGLSLGAGFSPEGNVAPSGTSAGFGSDSGQAASVTRAAISGVAGDASARTGDAPSGIARIFDAQQVQREVDAQMQITQRFGLEAPKAVASYAQGQMQALRRQAGETTDERRRADLLGEAAKWEEGGTYRVALHVATGALAGGSSGALGAGAVAAAAPVLDILQANLGQALREAGASESVARSASQVIAGTTSAVIGSAASGRSVAGAAMGFNVDSNNRQLHPTEIQWIKSNARRYAQHRGISEAEAERQLAAQAFRQVQFGALGEWDASAQAFLRQAGYQLLPDGGYLFYATPDQRANPLMYAESLASNADFYIKNGIRLPSAEQVAQAAIKDTAGRRQVGTLTVGAAAASALAAIAGASPTLLTWVLTNPDKAVATGLITAETAAGIATGAFVPGVLPQFRSASNAQVRQWYLAAEAQMLKQIDRAANLEVQAYQMWNLRNYYRTEARNMMADREAAAMLDMARPNATWVQVVEQYRAQGLEGDRLWMAIMDASQRSNADINRMLNVVPKR